MVYNRVIAISKAHGLCKYLLNYNMFLYISKSTTIGAEIKSCIFPVMTVASK